MLKDIFRAVYVAKEGLFALVRFGSLSAAVVAIVAAALVQVALVAGVVRVLDLALVKAKDRFELTVFMSPAAGDEDLKRVSELLARDARVSTVNLLTKEKALEEFRKDPDIQRMLEALGENPLTDSLTVVLKPEAGGLDDLVNLLERDPGVDEVHYGRGEWEAVSRLIRSVRLVGGVLAGFVLLASWFIIANALALMLASRRQEWRLLSRLGAPGWAKGGPFLLEGFLHGVLGSGLSILILEGFRRLLPYAIIGSGPLNAAIHLPSSDWSVLYLLMAAAGTLLGLTGAAAALRSPWMRSLS